MPNSAKTEAYEDIRILILEDNPADAELLENELREAGLVFVSKLVEDKESYTEALRHFHPDLILSDYNLPRFSGAEALLIRKKISPDTPFILVTGAVGEEKAIEILTGGATDYVLKRNLSRLLPAINRALHEAYERRKRRQAEAERDNLLKDMEERVRKRTEAYLTESVERKRVEEELRKSEERLQMALYGAGLGMWDLEIETLSGSVDERAAQILGYGKDDLPSGRIAWDEMTHPEDFPRFREDLNVHIQGLVPVFENDHRMRTMTGEWKWVRGRGKITERKADGTPARLTGTIQDINDRKLDKEALWESEKRYKLLVENIQDSISLMDLNLNYLYVSPSEVRLCGYTPEEVMRIPLRKQMPPASYSMIERLYAEEMGREYGGEPSDPNRTRIIEIEMYHKRGGTIWVESKLTFTRDVNGMPTGILVTSRDVTYRRSMEQALGESEKRFREMADTMPQLVWTRTADGRTDYFNCRQKEFPGIIRDPDGFWDWTQIIHPEDLPITIETARRGIEMQVNYEFEHRLQGKSGEYRWYISRCAAIRNEEGRVAKWVGTTTDIDDLKQAESALKGSTALLEQANKELEGFSYSVSHDLRAPLRAIDGFSRMLLKNAQALDDETKRKLKIIRDNALKMDRLINDLLYFSRSSRKPILNKKINMDHLMNEVWREQIAGNPNRRMELKKEKLPEAFGDEALIRQVLANLLANAVKFSRRRQKTVIEAGGALEGAESVFYVRDNGTGFDMQFYDKLFGVFQRLHSESEYEGTGLGLAIVQRIVHRHGGRVWAEGKVGKGATFYFSLPKETGSNKIG